MRGKGGQQPERSLMVWNMLVGNASEIGLWFIGYSYNKYYLLVSNTYPKWNFFCSTSPKSRRPKER